MPDEEKDLVAGSGKIYLVGYDELSAIKRFRSSILKYSTPVFRKAYLDLDSGSEFLDSSWFLSVCDLKTTVKSDLETHSLPFVNMKEGDNVSFTDSKLLLPEFTVVPTTIIVDGSSTGSCYYDIVIEDFDSDSLLSELLSKFSIGKWRDLTKEIPTVWIQADFNDLTFGFLVLPGATAGQTVLCSQDDGEWHKVKVGEPISLFENSFKVEFQD